MRDDFQETNEVVDDNKGPSLLKSVYTPVALFLVGMLGICLLGANEAKERATDALKPDVIKTYQNCEYRGESNVMVGYSVWDYISTSCGMFEEPIMSDGMSWKLGLEKGKSYDIEITDSKTRGSYISNMTPSE